MLKQPACAAAISSSGLVPLPSPNRAVNEYGVSFRVALCVVRLPLPSLPLACQTALARRLMLSMEVLLPVQTHHVVDPPPMSRGHPPASVGKPRHHEPRAVAT